MTRLNDRYGHSLAAVMMASCSMGAAFDSPICTWS